MLYFKLLIVVVFIVMLSVCLVRTNSSHCVPSLENLLSIIQLPPANRDERLPHGFQTTKDLILANGFDYMEFRVETEDGYILRVHRIIGKNIGGPPILFRHGFGAASDSWLMNGRNIDLAFQLADEGFDVWLDDRRGNWYSREHVKYKPNSLDFWNFSFHESAYYDLPAVINQIINITKYDQVFYVGHSMSCAEYLIMASLRPEYNDRIKLAVLLSPVAKTRRIENIKSPLIKLIMLSADSFYVPLLNRAGIYEVSSRTKKITELLMNCCGSSPYQKYCLNFYGLFFGENRNNIDLSTFNIKMSHWPAGASLKSVHHLSQIFKADFAQYDYGTKENLIRYQNTTPPLYPLHKVTSPVTLYWSMNDHFIDERAVNELADQLPNLVEVYTVEDPKFNHQDFIWGLNTNYLVNNRIIEVLFSFI